MQVQTKLRKKLVKLAVEIGEGYNVRLDLSEDSIRSIDEILEDIHNDYSKDLSEEKESAIYGISMEFAAYIIAVIEQHYGLGEWQQDSADVGEETWPFTVKGVTIFPVAWCIKRIKMGKTESIQDKYGAFLEALDRRVPFQRI